MSAPPRRPWFRYSLRTLFVLVTVVGVWLGWNVEQVRERKRLFESWEMSGGYFGYMGAINGEMILGVPGYGEVEDRLPLAWRWIGAEAIGSLHLPHNQFSEADLAHIRRLFPEANVSLIEDATISDETGRTSPR